MKYPPSFYTFFRAAFLLFNIEKVARFILVVCGPEKAGYFEVEFLSLHP